MNNFSSVPLQGSLYHHSCQVIGNLSRCLYVEITESEHRSEYCLKWMFFGSYIGAFNGISQALNTFSAKL